MFARALKIFLCITFVSTGLAIGCGDSAVIPSDGGAASQGDAATKTGDGETGDGGNDDGATGDGGNGDGAKPCIGLECSRPQCASGTTTISGKVFDPRGDAPLYNVVVYIPNGPLKTIVHGATCETCRTATVNSVGGAVLTNSKGEFKIEDAPAGAAIPLVFEVGKWRRQVSVKVEPCKDNNFVDPQTMRLPRNKNEGEMPRIALTTGGCDPLGCILRRIGIDAAEFTTPANAGAVQVYQGEGGGAVQGGGTPVPDVSLWNDLTSLARYDMVVLSCECDEHNNKKPAAAKTAMRDYLNAGGRVLATHYHYTWLKNGEPELAALATWTSNPGGNPLTVDQSFPKGAAFADWLQNINATTVKASLNATDVASDIEGVSTNAQSFISYISGGKESVKQFAFNAPVGAAKANQCGRGVLADIHAGGNSGTDTNLPLNCSNAATLSAQERALEFSLFDLSSCVEDDKTAPSPPKQSP